MKWLKTKIRNWLGITAIDKRTIDLCWDVNDSSGLKSKSAAHERVINLIIEMLSQPDKYNWKWEPKTKRWIVTHEDGWFAFEHSFYDMFENHTRTRL